MIKKRLFIVAALGCALSFFYVRGIAQQAPCDDTGFLSDYIDSLGLAAKLRLCVKCADSRPRPAIDSPEAAQAILNCYLSAQEEIRLAREMVIKHSAFSNPVFQELAGRTAFLYDKMSEIIGKSSAIYASIYEMWRNGVSGQKRMQGFQRDLEALDNERMQLGTLLLTACFKIKGEERKQASAAGFTVTPEQGKMFLRRLEGYFGPEVKGGIGQFSNGLAAAASVLYEELNRQYAAKPVDKKSGEVYINAGYGIEFPVPPGYRWKQVENKKVDSHGRTQIQLGIASLDLSADDPSRLGNAFITVSVYEYPHESQIKNLDMPEYVLATLDPKTQKIKSGIALNPASGFPAACYLVDESVSAGDHKNASSLIFLVRLSPFKLLELVATTLPKEYFDAYRLKFEEAFSGLRIIQ